MIDKSTDNVVLEAKKMPLDYPLVDVINVLPEDVWSGSELRIPISGKDGSSTCAFQLTVQPGETSISHRYTNCEVISVCLSGNGKGLVGGRKFGVRGGHCMRTPMGVVNKFSNDSKEPLQIVGFYIGANSLDAAGFEAVEMMGGANLKDGFVTHWDDVTSENMNRDEGWHINDFRLPYGAHNGSTTTLFRALFFPGAVHKKHAHQNCEEIYYLISGHGLAGAGDDRVEITTGQFHYIPAGVEHWLYNLSKTEPIQVIGVYIGSGSVAETGYIYRGEVTPEDIAGRTT